MEDGGFKSSDPEFVLDGVLFLYVILQYYDTVLVRVMM